MFKGIVNLIRLIKSKVVKKKESNVFFRQGIIREDSDGNIRITMQRPINK